MRVRTRSSCDKGNIAFRVEQAQVASVRKGASYLHSGPCLIVRSSSTRECRDP